MPLDGVPASPFIALKGRAQVTAYGKGKKMRKRKRTTKKGLGGTPSSSSSGAGGQPYSTRTPWPSSLGFSINCWYVLWPCRRMFLCTIEDGRGVLPDSRRERLGGPCRCRDVDARRGWNDQSHIVSHHGSHALVHRARSCTSHSWRWMSWWGPRAQCARGPYASLGRGRSMPRGSGAPILTLHGSGEAEIVPDGPGAPEA
jgi:hypothetical protein